MTLKENKILIVEDEVIIAIEIEYQLQNLGYTVTSIVDSGLKAIKKTEEDKPDLILMDIRIKGEMDGIEAAEVIRNKFGLPVIFLTAYLDEERLERAKLTIPFGYILKPTQERDVKVTIEMALYVAKIEVERKQTLALLFEKEKEMSSIFRVAPTGIGVVKDRVIQKVNNRFCEIVGYKQKELIGQSARIVYPSQEEYESVGSRKYQQIDKHGSGTVEAHLQKKDKSIISVLLASTPIDLSDLSKGVTFTVTDITGLKKVEDELIIQNKFFKNVINSVQHPFYIFNANTKIIEYANDATGQKVIGKTCHMATHYSQTPCDSTNHPCPIKQILETRKATCTRHIHLKPDGTEVVVNVNASPLFDEKGKVEYIAESYIEVTDGH